MHAMTTKSSSDKIAKKREKLSIFSLRIYKYYFLRIIRQPAPPHNVAMGVFCGVFAGCLIPLGQIFLAVAMAFVLRGSKVPAALATFISNPLTYPLSWGGAMYIGNLFLPVEFPEISEFGANIAKGNWHFLIDLGPQVCISYSIGGLIIASIFSPPAYLLTRKALEKRLARKKKKEENAPH